jgi:murein DD-endopeptidase MepM/ murein hydrolase activator NlpD
MKRFLISLFIALIICGGLVVAGVKQIKGFFTLDLLFDKEAPAVTHNIPEYVGLQPTTYTIKLEDLQAGLGAIDVYLEQGTKQQKLLSAVFDPQIGSAPVEFLIDPRALGLKEGDFAIKISGRDNAIFENSFSETLNLKFDFSPPVIEMLTTQHNATAAGVLFAIFKIVSTDVKTSGVVCKNQLYSALPLANFTAISPGADLSGLANIYAALIPISEQFNPENEDLTLVAEDFAGNKTQINFYQMIKPFNQRQVQMSLKRQFYEQSVQKLIGEYQGDTGKSLLPSNSYDKIPETELSDLFKVINHEYRAFLRDKIMDVLKSSKPERQWEGVFERPLAAEPTASYLEARKYYMDGTEMGGSIHEGVDLAHLAMSPVGAANHGTVLYAGPLGIYGNAVILDHGTSISSLYGHLSSIAVKVGDPVRKKAIIGRTGSTGLAGGDHLHFEVRCQGQPVNPREWIDPLWVSARIDNRIKEVMQSLGVQATGQTQDPNTGKVATPD